MKIILHFYYIVYLYSNLNCNSFTHKNPDFDTVRWKESYANCDFYKADIVDNLDITGETRECIEFYLGSPNRRGENGWTYTLLNPDCSNTLFVQMEMVILFGKDDKARSSTISLS